MEKIFLLEDDPRLVEEARIALTDKGYTFQEVDLSKAYNAGNKLQTEQYWIGLGITSQDLVILDLNFKQKGVNYSGIEVLRFIDESKGKLEGLERVLVATSMKQQLNSPDVCLTRNTPPALSVYGMEKATDAKREVKLMDYGTGLGNTVDRIYQGTERPLNE